MARNDSVPTEHRRSHRPAAGDLVDDGRNPVSDIHRVLAA
jgi:hypothetical protein